MIELQSADFMRRGVIWAHMPVTPRRAQEAPAPLCVELHGDRQSADPVVQREREMNRLATRLSVSETRPKKSSSMPLPPWAFEQTRLLNGIRELLPAYQHWLRYAYGDSTQWDDERGVTVALWERFEPTLVNVQDKTRQTCKGLAHLAVQDHKTLKNSGRGRSIWHVRELLGVTEASWDRHWRQRWQRMHEILDNLDLHALHALWEVTDVPE